MRREKDLRNANDIRREKSVRIEALSTTQFDGHEEWGGYF